MLFHAAPLPFIAAELSILQHYRLPTSLLTSKVPEISVSSVVNADYLNSVVSGLFHSQNLGRTFLLLLPDYRSYLPVLSRSYLTVAPA